MTWHKTKLLEDIRYEARREFGKTRRARPGLTVHTHRSAGTRTSTRRHIHTHRRYSHSYSRTWKQPRIRLTGLTVLTVTVTVTVTTRYVSSLQEAISRDLHTKLASSASTGETLGNQSIISVPETPHIAFHRNICTQPRRGPQNQGTLMLPSAAEGLLK